MNAPSVAMMGQPITVTWVTYLPSFSCTYSVHVYGPGLDVSTASGSTSVIPAGSPSSEFPEFAMYGLDVYANGSQIFNTWISVRVDIPPADAYGRRTINISQDYQTGDFVRALLVPNADVILADTVNLDLTGWQNIDIEKGVHISGGRSSTKPGARLFTTKIRTEGPEAFLRIGEYLNADGVRIDGLRIDGGDMGIAGDPVFQDNDRITPVGIVINSSRNIEIANSEIYGWSGIGIKVKDGRDAGRIDGSNWSTVWVHDNFIHHNRRWRHEGYGVQAHDGAQVLIERNVFDYNRHAIEASGADGTAYRAYNNLLLEHGGENFSLGLYTQYTHEFDVHGTKECDNKDAYCGPAGEYFDYRHNTLWYTSGDVVKVRGYPSIGADATANIFVKSDETSAISQTEGDNLWKWRNTFGALKRVRAGLCDFDGDTNADDLVTSGTAWWYRSAATNQYFYLTTSAIDYSRIVAAGPNADGRCELTDSLGTTYLNRPIRGGGATARLTTAANHGDIIGTEVSAGMGNPGRARMWQMRSDLTGPAWTTTVSWITFNPNEGDEEQNGVLLGNGDFNGDGAPDLLWRSGDRIAITLLDGFNRVVVPAKMLHQSVPPASSTSEDRGFVASGTQFAGIGDFTGDGRADILWRRSDGQMLLWPAGESGNELRMNYHRDLEADDPVGAEWQVSGVGDYNGDGYADIQWRAATSGQVVLWYFRGNTMIGDVWTGGSDTCLCWQIQQTADFDGDGRADTLWRAVSGNYINTLVIWFQGRAEAGYAFPSFNGILPGPDWHIEGAGDFTADGKADILWRHDNGTVVIWKMNGGSYAGQSAGIALDTGWKVRGVLAQPNQRMSLN